jgi:anti-anti-sigma factor
LPAHETSQRTVYPSGADTPNRVEVSYPEASLAIAELIGEHDLGQYESLETALLKAAVQALDVIVDLSRCEFMDSTVISLLLRAQNVVAGDHGHFAVVMPSAPGPVARMADMMRLGQLLSLHPSRDSAVASLNRPQPL